MYILECDLIKSFGKFWVNSMLPTILSHLDLEKLIIPCLILFVVIGFNAYYTRVACHGSFPLCKHTNWGSTQSDTSGIFLTFFRRISLRMIVGKYLPSFYTVLLSPLKTVNIENIASYWQEWKNSTQYIASEYCRVLQLQGLPCQSDIKSWYQYLNKFWWIL